MFSGNVIQQIETVSTGQIDRTGGAVSSKYHGIKLIPLHIRSGHV